MFILFFKWPMVSLDKPLFLSWGREAEAEALQSRAKLHRFGLQHVGCN